MVTSEELNMTFQKVGNDFGYGNVTVELSPYRDLKMRWTRSSDWINFEVSDYLREAPVEVIEGLARTVMSKIRGDDLDYPQEVSDWLTSEEFRELNQGLYIARSRMIAVPIDGDDRLQKSSKRIVDEGLIDRIDGLKLYWSKAEGSEKMGESSCLMRVAIMNPKLKNKDVPEEVLDFCLLHQPANINVGFSMNCERRYEEISAIMDACPEALRAQSWLDENQLTV